MIQRIQTIYLFLSVVLLCVCISLPIGVFHPDGMGVDATMFNMLIITDNPALQINWLHQPAPLFFILVLMVCLSLVAIFTYKNRKLQSKLCAVCLVLTTLWYGLYFVYGYLLGLQGTHFDLRVGMCLPIIAAILIYLARRGVIADERLVRAADRIR